MKPFILHRSEKVLLELSPCESEAVQLAARNLARDLENALGVAAVLSDSTATGTDSAQQTVSREAARTAESERQGTDIPRIRIQTNPVNKTVTAEEAPREKFTIAAADGDLVIRGSDRRGTVFGLYEFSSMIGVSPWTFWADVPVRTADVFSLPGDYVKEDHPDVELRGIFINDEEELERWAQRKMGEKTIGPRTYEKIFELMLRLKLNYLWPAMHVSAFNADPACGKLADRMGIIIGSTHCDILTRSNNHEWKPWLEQKGYRAQYDFTIPGENRRILEEYWREGVRQNAGLEVCYTLGMRGIHDSGLETSGLKDCDPETLLKRKNELMTEVFALQHRILADELGMQKAAEVPKIFVPYKEVLELYDHGLQVPEDLTIIWTNDNYGYMRRYPDRPHAAGYGLYYHNSYWAAPAGSYLFLCTIPLQQTQYELTKAWKHGIRRLWVTNFGALKPLEMQMAYYSELAWNAGRKHIVHHAAKWLRQWIQGLFADERIAKVMGRFMCELDQLTNTRKVELMENGAFAQRGFGDEAAYRLNRMQAIRAAAVELYEKHVSAAERAAFYELFLMKICSICTVNEMYYAADRSLLCESQGKYHDAQRYARAMWDADHRLRQQIDYYNETLLDGKWSGILMPLDFPPPRTAMYPEAVPVKPVRKGRKLILTAPCKPLVFYPGRCQSLEFASADGQPMDVRLVLPEEIEILRQGTDLSCKRNNNSVMQGDSSASSAAGYSMTVTNEVRLILKCREDVSLSKPDLLKPDLSESDLSKDVPTEVSLQVFAEELGQKWTIPLTIYPENAFAHPLTQEKEGRWIFRAEELTMEGLIPSLGRTEGPLADMKAGDSFTLPISLTEPQPLRLYLDRYPSLNAVGRMRVGVSVDGVDRVMESLITDEHRGNWRRSNVLDGVDRMDCALGRLEAGTHRIQITFLDAAAFSRVLLVREGTEMENLGVEAQGEPIPQLFGYTMDQGLYPGTEQAKQPILYLPEVSRAQDSLANEDIARTPQWMELPELITGWSEASSYRMMPRLSGQGKGMRIDAAVAWFGPFASRKGQWRVCASPTYAERGMALVSASEAENELQYLFSLEEGTDLTFWFYLYMWGNDASHLELEIDETLVSEQELLGGRPFWRYANEHVWKWYPLHRMHLDAGDHTLTMRTHCRGLRIDQISIRREGLPLLPGERR